MAEDLSPAASLPALMTMDLAHSAQIRCGADWMELVPVSNELVLLVHTRLVNTGRKRTLHTDVKLQDYRLRDILKCTGNISQQIIRNLHITYSIIWLDKTKGCTFIRNITRGFTTTLMASFRWFGATLAIITTLRLRLCCCRMAAAGVSMGRARTASRWRMSRALLRLVGGRTWPRALFSLTRGVPPFVPWLWATAASLPSGVIPRESKTKHSTLSAWTRTQNKYCQHWKRNFLQRSLISLQKCQHKFDSNEQFYISFKFYHMHAWKWNWKCHKSDEWHKWVGTKRQNPLLMHESCLHIFIQTHDK